MVWVTLKLRKLLAPIFSAAQPPVDTYWSPPSKLFYTLKTTTCWSTVKSNVLPNTAPSAELTAMSGWDRVRWQIFPPSSSMTSSHWGNVQKAPVSFAWRCSSFQRQTSRVQHFDPAAWIILQPAASATASSHSQRLASDKPSNISKQTKNTQFSWLPMILWSEDIWKLQVYLLTQNELCGRDIMMKGTKKKKPNTTFGDNPNWQQLFFLFYCSAGNFRLFSGHSQ